MSLRLDWHIMADSLGDLGEREILRRVLRPRYQDSVVFGDDCAVLGDELVATTDNCPTPLVNLLGETDLFYTGWLLATINLSDLAAAGATPLGLVTNYTLPPSMSVGDFERLLDGVDTCAATHDTRVVGGDVRDGTAMALSATAIGRCVPGRRLGRTGASAGDRLLLVGSPGYLWAAALLAGRQATLPDRDAARVWEKARMPRAQVPAGRLLARGGLATAAMDVSDGLYATVRTLCEVNGVGATMVTDVTLDPVLARVCAQAGVSRFDLAATWGDWCLLVAVAPDDVDAATAALAGESIPARVVGTLVDGEAITLERGGPWHGMAQERFSARSWRGDLEPWMADLLG